MHRRQVPSAALLVAALLSTVLSACGAKANQSAGTQPANPQAPAAGAVPAGAAPTSTTGASGPKAGTSGSKTPAAKDGSGSSSSKTQSAAGAAAGGSSKASSSGRLDKSFGGGLVKLAKGTRLNAAALQSDGKLVVTGSTGDEDAPHAFVARLTSSGKLDASFAKGGRMTVRQPSDAGGTIGEDVAIQRDGKIVVAGDVRGQGGSDGMLVARLNKDGSPDRGFGRSGVASLLRGVSRQAEAHAVDIGSSGQIVVGGGASKTAALMRLSPSGKAVGKVGLMGIGPATIEGLALKRNGQIVFAGTRKVGQTTLAIVGRARPNARKDASFGRGGIRERNYARKGGAASGFRDVGVQADGRIVAAGYAFDGRGGGKPGAFAITARFSPGGAPDTSFGPGGVRYTRAARTTDVSTQPPPGFAGVAIGRTRIFAGGSWDEFGSSALMAGARTRSGKADPGFGQSGQTITPVSDYEQPGFGNDVALGGAGLYVVGTAGSDDKSNGVIARFTVGARR